MAYVMHRFEWEDLMKRSSLLVGTLVALSSVGWSANKTGRNDFGHNRANQSMSPIVKLHKLGLSDQLKVPARWVVDGSGRLMAKELTVRKDWPFGNDGNVSKVVTIGNERLHLKQIKTAGPDGDEFGLEVSLISKLHKGTAQSSGTYSRKQLTSARAQRIKQNVIAHFKAQGYDVSGIIDVKMDRAQSELGNAPQPHGPRLLLKGQELTGRGLLQKTEPMKPSVTFP